MIDPSHMNTTKKFYEDNYEGDLYAPSINPLTHPDYTSLYSLLEQQNLWDKRCLEIGTGRGSFQNLVNKYMGVDIAFNVKKFIQKPFVVASATELPFQNESFDLVWTITVLEHVNNPTKALEEIWRVLKPGGYIFLAPAWHCRPWMADGYPVRPYSDFDWKGKAYKASIPLRNSLVYRMIDILPKRTFHLFSYWINKQPTIFKYRELNANFERYWTSDSDALNSMDPFEAYLWFVSRGGDCTNYDKLYKAFLIRSGPLVFNK